MAEVKVTQESQQKIWDAIPPSCHAVRQKPQPDLDSVLKNRRASWNTGAILEVGCGNCRNLLHFSYNDFNCYGVDFSKEMLSMAEQYCKKHDLQVKLKHGFATALPFKDSSFDYVLSISMLQHLSGEERLNALREIRRVLKRNGKALVTVWNKLQGRFFFKKSDTYVPWHVKNKKYQRYYHIFTPWELESSIKSAGFQVVRKNFFGKNLIFIVERK